MREIETMDEALTFCRALGSPVRMQMMRILTKRRAINLNELAKELNLTNGAITPHIKTLHEAGIIEIENISGKRGLMKSCRLKENKFMLDFQQEAEYQNKQQYQTELPVGSYTRYNVSPTCCIASTERIIGEVDDNRYFDDPSRTEAGILWFCKGFVEYRIPNYLKSTSTITELQISFEISSEAPGVCEDWPSDIYFYFNDTCLGYWTSPGDFSTPKGIYTPDWWFPNWNQYGLLKLLSVNETGTYIDGRKISDVKLSELNLNHTSPMALRFEIPDTAENIGGLTIFGKGFGNYNQDIKARVIYQ